MVLLNTKSKIYLTDYISDRTRNLTGWDWVFGAIRNWLFNPDGSRYFLLTQEAGSGKTAIAAHLIQTHKDIVAYHLCQAAELETLKPGRILRSPSKPKQLEAS